MNSSFKKYMTVSGIIAIAWLFIMIAIHFYRAGFYGWVTVLGGIVAYAAAAVFLNAWDGQRDDSPDLTEINALGYIFAAVYLAAAFIINIIVCVIGLGMNYSGMIPGAVNLIMLAIWLAVSAFLPHYRSGVAKTADKAINRVHSSVQAATKLSELMTYANDDEVRNALRHLKENVDYSSNVSSSFTSGFEKEFESFLDTIRDMIENGSSREEILKTIQDAERLWKTRNGVSSSVR